MKVFGWTILLLLLGFITVMVAGSALNWFGRATTVVSQEVDPQVLLTRYEWFKEAAAQLDKKAADIKVYDARLRAQDAAYEGVSRKDWPRDERQQRAVWEGEVAGVTASYNALAAEYNAQMAKINWRFTNVGALPRGAAEVLPREFRVYEEGQ